MRSLSHRSRAPLASRPRPQRPQSRSDWYPCRVAVVTGGSRGIGRAIAIALAERGATVAISYRERADAAQDTVRCIHERRLRGFAHPCDISKEGSIRDFFDAVRREIGTPDILV